MFLTRQLCAAQRIPGPVPLAPAPATRRHPARIPVLSKAASNSVVNSRDHCFALDTMSIDGQGWVLQELGEKLVGLAHRTPRATCRTTELLSYQGDISDGDKSLRCDRLDLDLGWEASCKAAEGKTFTGKAKVTMCRKDKDMVDVAVTVDPACLAALPEGRERLVADVVYAVESLDTAIMEQLNDFLWSMESRNPRQLPEGPEQAASQSEQAASQSGEGPEWALA